MPPHQSIAARPALVRRRRDLAGFLPGPVVAPQVVVVDRLQLFIHRNHAGSGGIERDGFDRLSVYARRQNGAVHGFHQRAHVVGVALRGVVGIFFLPQQRIFARPRAQPSALAIENGNADAQCAEIHSGNDAHSHLLQRLAADDADERG